MPRTLAALADWLGVRREWRKRLESEERSGKERVLGLIVTDEGAVLERKIEGEQFVLRIFPRDQSFPDWERIAAALAIDVAQAKERFTKRTVTTVLVTERL